MAITPPPKNWHKKPLGKDEKLWLVLMAIMLIMMGTMTTGWVFVGKQNIPEEYHRIPTDEIQDQFRKGNENSGATIDTLSNGADVLALPDGGELYLVASQWNWSMPYQNRTDIKGMQLTVGKTYRLHVASTDVLHGFQLIGTDFLVAIQIVPGYDYVIDFIPNETGLFRIICNEYCGQYHHQMTAFMKIVEAP